MSIATSERTLVKVNMAGIGYGKRPDELETLLGSCVGIAVWDCAAGVGGLAHVVLADSESRPRPPGKFADTAVVELKRQLAIRGANPQRLSAKIAGGATMFGKRTKRDVGEKNYQAALRHLKEQGIALTAEHVGGTQGRVIRFSLRDASLTVMVARKQVAVI